MDRTGEFLALIFRSKGINRWGLMRNLSYETLSEHCFEVAVMSHVLALIGNQKFNKKYDVNKIAVYSLYHDMSEILTGDLPTPIKYYNSEIKDAYKKIENEAEKMMLDLLPKETEAEYKKLFELTSDDKKIVKAADKICAYIKCKNELSGGNKEFIAAERTIFEQMKASDVEEINYFIENYLDAFSKPLDDIKL